MNFINSDFPEKIILSRDKDEILNVFLKKIPKKFISKCKFVLKLKKNEQLKIFGLSEKQLSYASDREFSVPLIFKGNKAEKNNLFKAPETYMEKISTKVSERNVVDLDYSVKKIFLI